MTIQFRVEEIPAQSTYGVRKTVLWPQGPDSLIVVSSDAESTHFGVLDVEGRVVAVASLVPPPANQKQAARIRKVAVLPEFQGRGLGKLLMTTVVSEARSRGLASCVLNARPEAENFYLKCGFHPVGEPFVDPAHQQMRRLYESRFLDA
eukprot:Gregarina_sp_Pseudo_9__5582@NODE_754_length_2265_cov_9_788410_g710_i0_p4_GENE_NODE_754_length_2265_cov_9_788410_g710_i0NODE_754_length_2265_cov_9_788410_g710_i0_p4_ORF_typecomplete_len149_score24_22Acetyltransf_10/PF13673_7/2_7e23Acetyltransf_1/PF00583_25/2_5e20Acetyltransf_1/PF00583_25/8e02Acetyltransf_9/PF13527_7/3_5e14Acetyltransf_7/PF13508_7/3e13Acetyltransf_7/PF13508_7/4e03GNAT_acetyltran/PF12746_7/7_2e10Acetyltransf_4/PF13420_7/2_6e09FR47/PF08445_10/2_1e08NodA/PF02474_15/1_1e06Acetyltransf